MRFTKREKQIFYICVSLITLLILERIVFRPLADKLAGLNQEIQLKETRLIKGLRAQGQRDKIIKDYKSYEGYLKLKGSDEEIVSELLREIERLARESTVSILDIKPQSMNKRAMYKEYTIEVRSEATFKDIITFLYRLNNSLLLLRVEKLVLSLKEENSDILKISMLLSGIVLL